MASILRENMLVYLFSDKISSSRLTTFSFLEFSKRERGYRWKISVPHYKLHLKQKKGKNLQFIISQSIFSFKRFGVRFDGAINVSLRIFFCVLIERDKVEVHENTSFPPFPPPPPHQGKKRTNIALGGIENGFFLARACFFFLFF